LALQTLLWVAIIIEPDIAYDKIHALKRTVKDFFEPIEPSLKRKEELKIWPYSRKDLIERDFNILKYTTFPDTKINGRDAIVPHIATDGRRECAVELVFPPQISTAPTGMLNSI
jgi:hypothetical protein